MVKLFVLALLLIHTIDMVLTERCVGDNWEIESFLPMQLCIKHIGIFNSLWVSRLCVYGYAWLSLYFCRFRSVQITLAMVAILYWTSMYPWLFHFQILGALHEHL